MVAARIFQCLLILLPPHLTIPVKYAYGWGHMFDKLIHEKAVAIKNVMYNSKRGVLYLVVEK